MCIRDSYTDEQIDEESGKMETESLKEEVIPFSDVDVKMCIRDRGYAAYPVHVFLVLVGCWLGWLRFASLQGMSVQMCIRDR